MRVAFVTNVVFPFVKGGAEKRIHEIGTRLADRGHDVTVYGRHFWDGPEEMAHAGMTLRAVAPGTNLYTDGGRRSIPEALDFSARLVPKLRRHLGEHDVVVASVFPYFPVLSAKLCSLDTDTPLITTWHEVWDGYWSDYLGALAPFGWAVERLTGRVPQYPVAVSENTADRLTRLGPDRSEIRTVSNGIDYDQIRDTDPAPDGYDVLFTGRLIEDKRVDILLEAFDRVGPSNTTLGIIGEGPRQDELVATASGLDSAEQIQFLGFLDDYEDVIAHMRAADVFASPSTREGFGLVFAEAMAAGCTVVAADHPDSAASEVIGDAGFLPAPTVEAVADALNRSLDGDRPPVDPAERAKRYDWNRVADDALDAYSAALAGAW